MTTLKQKITAFGKKQPKFRKKGHKYKQGDVEYTSVTNFVHSFFPEFDAKSISKYVAKSRRAKGEKVTATQVKKEWKAVAEEGSLIHKELEEFILSSKRPLKPKSKGGVAFLEDMGYDDRDKYFLNSELMIWSDKDLLCGTSDLVIEDGTNNLTIVDWKTNKEIKKTGREKGKFPPVKDIDNCNYTQYTLQLSTYAYILESEFGFKVTKLILVHLQNNGYEVYVVPYLKNTVEAMLLWRKQQEPQKK